jgi:hypothetical protein
MKVLSDTPLYSAELPLFFLDVGPNLAHFIFKYFAEKNRNPLIRSLNTTGSRNLRFKYHMYGNDTGTLLVKAKLKGDNSVLSLWSLSGNQDNDWDQVCIPLNIAAMTDVELSFLIFANSGKMTNLCSFSTFFALNFDKKLAVE